MSMKNPGLRTKYCIVLCGILLSIASVFSLSHAMDIRASSAYEQELLKYINRHRMNNGLARLSFDDTLGKIARNHSNYMNNNKELNHDHFDDRFRQCRRACCVENIGWNYMTPEEQFKAWKNSKGHNKNMLNKQIQHAGISIVGAYVTFFACD